MAPFDESYTTWSAVVSLVLFHSIFQLFDAKQYRVLEIWVKSHSRSFKMVPFESLDTVSYSQSLRPYLVFFEI